MEINKVKIKHIAVSSDLQNNEVLKTITGLFAKEDSQKTESLPKYRFLAGVLDSSKESKNIDNKSIKQVLCYIPTLSEICWDINKNEIETHTKYIFEIPEKCKLDEAVCLMMSAIRIYSDIFFKGKCTQKEKVLILNGANMYGYLALQILKNIDCEVFTSVNSEDESKFLETIFSKKEINIIKAYECDITKAIQNETIGIGVDCIIDCEYFSSSMFKRDIIGMLAPGGRWVTHDFNLQLDPPESLLLFLKNCSINFSFEEASEIYGLEFGKIRLIILEALDLLNEGKIIVSITRSYESIKSYEDSNTNYMNIGSSVITINK